MGAIQVQYKELETWHKLVLLKKLTLNVFKTITLYIWINSLYERNFSRLMLIEKLSVALLWVSNSYFGYLVSGGLPWSLHIFHVILLSGALPSLTNTISSGGAASLRILGGSTTHMLHLLSNTLPFGRPLPAFLGCRLLNIAHEQIDIAPEPALPFVNEFPTTVCVWWRSAKNDQSIKKFQDNKFIFFYLSRILN